MLQELIALFYPNCCYSCGNSMVKTEEIICNECIETLPYTNESIDSNYLANQLLGQSPLQGVYALFYYNKNNKVQHLINELKYNGHKEIGLCLGKLLAAKLSKELQSFDCLVPVPLHSKKLKRRGYNQSEWIAKGISEISSIPIRSKYLIRSRPTSTQTNKSRIERHSNMRDAFRASDDLTGKRVVLVDDVITTGATGIACAEAMFNSGARAVLFVAAAKANPF